MKSHTKKLTALGACSEAVRWAETQPDAQTAWDACERPDWMLWLLGKLNKSEPWSDERKPLIRACIDCAETALRYANNDTITANLWCLDALRRWCDGEADRDAPPPPAPRR